MTDLAKSSGPSRPKSPAVASSRSVVARTSRGRVLRSRGQQLLCELSETSAEIGRVIGCAKQTVAQWRAGDKTPSPEALRKLEAAFPSVPAHSWSDRPLEAASEAPARSGEVSADHAPGPHELAVAGTLGELDDLLADVRLIRRNPKSLVGERVKCMALEESILARRAKLELQAIAADDWLEDAWCRTARWQRFEDILMNALRSVPGATEAVLAALEKL